ncbi:hypothetical protein ACT80S_15530 [Ramlibacter sp. MAHUQ-53]|uniref:hypothetical protein n=1 Tax=unclassified Ramlibacter TaxID=2617605 RepID=UPI00362DF322
MPRGPAAIGLAAALLAGPAAPSPALAQAQAQALRERHAQLLPALRRNEFGRPIHVASQAQGEELRGEVHAELEHPFAAVREALRPPGRWCEVLVLPFNTLDCEEVPQDREGGAAARGDPAGAGPVLALRVGRRPDQPPQQAFALRLSVRTVAEAPDYLEVRLEADRGPMGARDLRISVAAMPLAGGRSFLRLGYAYGAGLPGRMAMRAYLATAGAGKVGFSTEPGEDGRPRPVGGLRGVVERNAMRHYLAIDATLGTLQATPRQRVEAWFDAAQRYPQQLHEMDKATYVALKEGVVARVRERAGAR